MLGPGAASAAGRAGAEAQPAAAQRLVWRHAAWEAPLAAALATGAGAIATRSGWFLACAAPEAGTPVAPAAASGLAPIGLGEVVPWPAWGTETPAAVAAALTAWPAACPAPADPAAVPACLDALGLDPVRLPALWAGAELALLDWLARRDGVSLATLLADGGPVAASVPVAALVSGDAPQAAALAAAAAVAAGHRVVKLKVTGQGDLARVAAVRAAVGPDVALRLDANQAWGEAAEALLAAVAPFRPAFVEQPVAAADRAGLMRLAAGAVPVAADEALGWPGAAGELLAGGVKVLVVKPLVMGGLLAARALIAEARAAGARVVLSSALDRGVGTAGALHLAAASAGLPPAGLGTAGWWADGGALAGLVPAEGGVRLPAGPGLAFAVTDAVLGGLVADLASDLTARHQPAGCPPARLLAPPGPWPALVGAEGEAFTHAELEARVAAQAAHLAAQGVGPGDLVALWGPNAAAWVLAARAAWHLGAALLPLPPRWTDAEAAGVLGRARPRLVVGPLPQVARARALGFGGLTYDDLAAPATAAAPPRAPLTLAAVVPTSGTTGAPKLACLTAQGLAATADATAAVLGIGPGDRYWLPLPLHHVGGLGALWRAWRAGATLLLGAGPDGATHASLVPTQLHDLAGAAWPAGLRAVMVGGAAPPPDLLARCPAAWGTYGLTEAGGTVTLSPAGEAAGTAGLPLPGWEVAILGPAGERLSVDAEGAIALRGPGVMAGYRDDPAASEAALAGGWLRTGDLGALDARGRLVVRGRRTDLIVSGGENIYPAEVEAALRAHPAIADAAVVGAPDARWGHVPVAFVVARPHVAPPHVAPPDLAGLRAFLDARLARFKHPHAVTWLPALPRLASGKLDRRALAGLALEAAR